MGNDCADIWAWSEKVYEYAKALGELTPEPLAYLEIRQQGLLRESYYACRLSDLPYTFRQVERDKAFPNRLQIIKGVAKLMVQLHEKGFYPLDFSGGNILLNADGTRMQLVDLNRMHRCRSISVEQGLKQAYRLVLTDAERQLLNKTYIALRNA